jgi:AraC family transcriptional regulator, L-rhamnose operon transcriptional activator RhaR
MNQTRKLQHLTVNKIFPHQNAPYAICRHQVDGDHISNVHDHDFVELVMISGGRGVQLTPYGDVPLRAGAMFVLQPGVWHGYTECEDMLVNVCAVDGRLFDCELAWLRDNAPLRHVLWETAITPFYDAVPIHYLLSHQIVQCSRAFYRLQEIETRQTSHARIQQLGQLTIFLAEIAEFAAMNIPSPVRDGKLTALSPVVEKTLMLFSENLARDWSITELSASFGLTTPYYIRLFKREMGEAPLSYLSGLRAQRAAQLLLRCDSTITQIGGDVGWQEPGYFSRRFRHYFGISPREYRQKYSDFSHT